MPPKFHNDFLINQWFESYLVVILAENLLEFQHSCKTCLSLSKSDNEECNLGSLFCQELADILRLLTNFFLDFNHVRFLKQYQNCIVTSSYAWESVFLMITRSNLGEGVHPPPPKSWLLHMVWSWNLYPQYFLTKDVDWRRHYFGHVTHMYFTDQKTIFAEVSINEKWHHQWTSFIKGSYWWKIQVDTTTRSQDIAWSLIFPIMLGL